MKKKGNLKKYLQYLQAYGMYTRRKIICFTS